MAVQPPGGYQFVRTQDLKDPQLTVLNTTLQRFDASISTLQSNASSANSSGSSATSGWVSFAPKFTSASGSLSAFQIFTCEYNSDGNGTVSLNIDVEFTVTGSTNTFTISVPVTPANGTSGNVLPCTIFMSSTPIPAIARLIGNTITVQRADGAAITAGGLETMLTGFYRGQ